LTRIGYHGPRSHGQGCYSMDNIWRINGGLFFSQWDESEQQLKNVTR